MVIPTYNRCESVCRALASLAHQRGAPAFEAVVVVDGSTDGTAEALGGLALPFTLRVLEQPNRGAAAARNAGWRAAAGRIVLFLDDDMEPAPDVVARHVAAHCRGAHAVTGAIAPHPESRRSMLTDTVDAWYVRFAEEVRARPRTPRFDEIITGHLSVQRHVLEALGGFDEHFTRSGSYGNEDVDLGYRMLAGGWRVVSEPEAVTRQRYTVTALEHLRQYRRAGAADVLLARKHPELGTRVFDDRRAGSPIHRRVWRVSLAAPWLVGAVHAVAAPPVARLVDRGVRSGPLWWAFFALREAGYWLGVADAGGIPSSRRPLRILCYHALADLASDPVLARYGVPPEVFEGQLRTLQRAGWHFLDPGEAIRYLRGGGPVPGRAVLITFDDGYDDLLARGQPALASAGAGAVVFAVAGRLGGTNDWDRPLGARALRLLDAEGLRALAASGVEVGAHGLTHRSLAGLGAEEVAAEVRGALDRLEAAGLPRPRLFAYPYGAWDEQAARAVRAAGLVGACTVDPGVVGPGTDRAAIPRIEIGPADRGLRLRAKVRLAGRARLPGAAAVVRARRRFRPPAVMRSRRP